MRKIFILISHLFLLSFSIYGHSDPFDVSKFLNDFFNESKNVDRLKYEIYNVMPSKGSMVLKFHVSLGSKLDLCSSGSADELKIVRLCPENKENFKDKVWEEYKEEILAKCQARYSEVKVEYAKDGSISAIIDTMNIYSPIRFYTSVIQESEIIPLSHDKKDQLIKRMNYITRYHFVELDVKVRDAGFGEPIKEEKLPIAILKKGSGCFFDKLETGDTRLQIIYSEPKTIVDFEYREFSCGTSDNSD
ncbi:MAG: hypothetical protein PUP46_06475, partial [Endozoicomonas sp. (ex Botrylloides leachii)]|nr:hypothetical protein [Endozoicomonas sp. (ex Botrylloides leachii)]